jgi:hypothetical protein
MMPAFTAAPPDEEVGGKSRRNARRWSAPTEEKALKMVRTFVYERSRSARIGTIVSLFEA